MGNKSHSDRVAADHTGEETTRSLENWPKKKKIPCFFNDREKL